MTDPETPDVPEGPDVSSDVVQAAGRASQALDAFFDALGQATHRFRIDVRLPGVAPLETSGCGCAIAILLLVGVLIAAIIGFQAELFSPATTSVEVGPATPDDLAFSNEYNSEGQLMPIPGEWQIYNEAGVADCEGDLELEAGLRRGLLELVDPDGRQIRVKPLFGDNASDDGSGWTTLHLISSSESKAVYEAEDVGPDGTRMTAVFTSSSTLGARLEECATRGGQGWLEEPATGGSDEP